MLYRKAKKIISNHKKHLVQQGVSKLSLFGSVASNNATVKSDIDILVDLDPTMGLFGFMRVKNYLEEILQCRVDLVTKNALHPALRKKILSEAKDVF